MNARAGHLALAVAAVSGCALAGCGDGEPTPAADVGLVDTEVEVLAIDNVFDPEMLEVEAGTTVVFRNAGRNDHNVIPADETAGWAIPTEAFGPTDVGSVRFTEPGEYPYYCSIHGTADVGMIGAVTVTPPGG